MVQCQNVSSQHPYECCGARVPTWETKRLLAHQDIQESKQDLWHETLEVEHEVMSAVNINNGPKTEPFDMIVRPSGSQDSLIIVTVRLQKSEYIPEKAPSLSYPACSRP